MAGYTAKEKETLRHNILKLDAAIVRLLEKRLGYAAELRGEQPLPLMKDELLNLVVNVNKPVIAEIMEHINTACHAPE